MRNLRLHYDAVHGWLIDTPWALLPHHVRSVVAYALPKQEERVRYAAPGDRRNQMVAALELLRQGKVRERIVGANGNSRGDLEIFNVDRYRSK